nr:dienelactone hydrolase family protein [Microbacterium bovistercoris]
MPALITLNTPDGETFDCFVARPDGVPRGGLVLIHEIWGLTEHITDVADRFAGEGYLVIAPDILSHAGVEPALGAELFALMNSADEAERTAGQPRMRESLAASRAPEYAEWAVAALRATVDRLAADLSRSAPPAPAAGGIGVVGYCFGGTYAFLLAAADDRIRAVVPFYGTAPDPERMARIQAPILALYGGRDRALMDALPAVRTQMAAAGVDFTAHVYPEASHAFFNDTGSRYDPTAAADAWEQATAFLAAHV